MAFSPAATLRKQATHRVAFFAALVFCCFGVACTEDAHPLQMDWVDTDGTAVSLRIEDGSLNLYGDDNLVIQDVKYTQFTATLMLFSANKDFKNAAESRATSWPVVTGVKRLIGVANQMAQAEPRPQAEAPATTGEAPEALPSVEWTDTEGDAVALRGTGGLVSLWANGEEVMPIVAGVQLYNDGVSLNFVSSEGPEGVMTALTVARDDSDVKMVQDFLNTHARGPPPGGGAAPQNDPQQQADALRAFAEFVQEQKERQQRSRKRTEIAGIFVEDQKDLAEPKPVVTQHHVLHLGRRTFAETVLPPTSYPVENWIVMFCYSWYEPCQDIMDPYSAWSRDWEAKLNQDLFTTRVRFARVDCATDKELCNAQDVEGYPHIKQYSEGVAVAKWTGGRQKDAARLAKWLTKRLGAPAEPEGGEQLEEVQPDPSLVARERGINALLVLGVSALVFRAVCLDAELWKGPTTAPPAAAQDGHSAPPAGPRGLPAEWARRGSVEL
mmetsp:Transcript_69283/g.180484  ORF Transcript_69283/g.180484 Transcript_69283/m.180484 type:complete len:497 (+) Transcript_69283:124-1614(+)